MPRAKRAPVSRDLSISASVVAKKCRRLGRPVRLSVCARRPFSTLSRSASTCLQARSAFEWMSCLKPEKLLRRTWIITPVTSAMFSAKARKTLLPMLR